VGCLCLFLFFAHFYARSLQHDAYGF
jgi:hypothetical protein